jgi:type III secretion protein Q
VEIVVAGQSMSLAALGPGFGDQKFPRCVVAFTVGGADGELDMPRALVERWLVQADPDVDLGRLRPEHAALLLESLFDSELGWLEGNLGCQVALTAIENRNARSDAAPLVFSLRTKQDDIAGTLRVTDMNRAAQLGQLLDGVGKSAPALPLELPMPVSLWRGAVKISLGDVQSLRPGDVVLLDDVENEAATALMVIGGRFVAPFEFTSEGPCLVAGLRPVTGSKWEWIMDQAKNPDAAQALDDADLENLPVTLVFELGRTALPLGEFKQLAPGAIVPLPEVAKETVDVIANGKRVGRGEIVRIGESLGVRLVRMFDNA